MFENDSLKRDNLALKELETKCLQLAAEVADKSELCEKLESDLKRETKLSRNLHKDNEFLEGNIQTLEIKTRTVL